MKGIIFKMFKKNQHFFRNVLSLILIFLVLKGFCEESFLNFEDTSPDPKIFQTDQLPRDEQGTFLPRYMASVGNGHVATTIFTDTVFMNGLYNGFKGQSHRARIPSRNNIQIEKSSVNSLNFSLHVEEGIFSEKFNIGNYQVEHRIFAHRYYHTVIINQIEIKSLQENSETLELELKNEPGIPSPDLELDEEMKYESVFKAVTQCGRTTEVEDSRYQSDPSTICIISSKIPSTLTISTSINFTFFTAYAKTLADASVDFNMMADLVSEEKHEEILTSHTNRWKELWDSGRIEIEGNLKVAKIINGCFYYFLSSLPITTTTNSPSVGEFYGLSPGGLANGAQFSDFQGHIFWDMDIWMFPAILYFFPDAAKEILNYRLYRIDAARELAKDTGYKGARFPWESGRTGSEVTPECCPDVSNNQIHITGDIAYAIRQYISTTKDLIWLTQTQPDYKANGFTLLKEIAQFWISRMTYDPIAQQHEILHVMPPDDDHHDVDNSVYTNVVASYAIFFAKYTECLKKMRPTKDDEENEDNIPDFWVDMAKSLKLNHDPHLNYHPEYEGYPVGEFIKQADAVLLGFPLMYQMDPQTRKNDLLLYGNVTRSNGPAMTWAMHTIGFLELDEETETLFHKSFLPYIRLPFYVWTEAQPPTLGAVNFMTGMGGFLQEIISGYAGLRLYPEKIVFLKPRVLPQSQSLKLLGLKYLDNVLDIEIDNKEVILTLRSTLSHALTIEFPDGKTTNFQASTKISLPIYPALEKFEIKADSSKCPLPADLINEGYSSRSSRLYVLDNWLIVFLALGILIWEN